MQFLTVPSHCVPETDKRSLCGNVSTRPPFPPQVCLSGTLPPSSPSGSSRTQHQTQPTTAMVSYNCKALRTRMPLMRWMQHNRRSATSPILSRGFGCAGWSGVRRVLPRVGWLASWGAVPLVFCVMLGQDLIFFIASGASTLTRVV